MIWKATFLLGCMGVCLLQLSSVPANVAHCEYRVPNDSAWRFIIPTHCKSGPRFDPILFAAQSQIRATVLGDRIGCNMKVNQLSLLLSCCQSVCLSTRSLPLSPRRLYPYLADLQTLLLSSPTGTLISSIVRSTLAQAVSVVPQNFLCQISVKSEVWPKCGLKVTYQIGNNIL